MTNQAAQTMPAVEAAVNAGLASYHGVKTFSSEVRLRSALEATARAMLAAAPAASGVDTSTNEAWAARAQEKIAAMEAATGGEACGCIYYGLGKAAPYLCEMHKARKADPHPPPAASVSERARELEQAQRLAVSLWERNYKESSPDWKVDETLTGVLLQISNMVSGMSLRSNADNRFADLVVSLRDRAKCGRGGRFTSPHDSKGTSRLLDMAADAIEQALTQQRGDGEAVDRDAWAEALELPEGYTVEEFLPGGWHYAWTRADGERMVSGTTWNHPALAAIAAWQYAPDTTPQPSADAVRELVKRWRECAKSAANGPMFDGASEYAVAGTYIACADELESLISGGSHA